MPVTVRGPSKMGWCLRVSVGATRPGAPRGEGAVVGGQVRCVPRRGQTPNPPLMAVGLNRNPGENGHALKGAWAC
jgi:hypothetical protein